MNISQVFGEVALLGLDTAPIIYYMEDHPRYNALINEIFIYFEHANFEMIVSSLVLTEVMSQPIRLGNKKLATSYYRLITETEGLRAVPADIEIAQKAASLRAQFALRTVDALHLAIAIVSGCDSFLTNDHALKRVTDIRVLILDDFQTVLIES